MNRKTIYLTLDGLLEPLGYSQVARYLMRLAEMGHQLTCVSLEKEAHLANQEHLRQVEREMANAGVRWHYDVYRRGPAGAMSNVTWLGRNALRECAGSGEHLIWARGYIPALAAYLVHRLADADYVFDTRGYWIDERRDGGGLFANDLAYSLGKGVERSLFARAKTVIGLTRHVGEDLANGEFGDFDGSFVKVPTCADFDEFLPTTNEASTENRTFGYVGSFNSSYHAIESFRLFRMIAEASTGCQLLVLTGQPEVAWELIHEARIPTEICDVMSVPHQDVSHYLSKIDYGFLLCRSSFAKRASMPTKLAEFFAAGIHPIALPLNQEMEELIREAGTGYLLEDATEESLRKAASWAAEHRSSLAEVTRARKRMRPHLSLEFAIQQCSRLLDDQDSN